VSPARPTDPPTDAVEPAEDLPEQMKVRRAKRERMLAEGRQPYPAGSR